MNDISHSSQSEGLVGMEEHFEHINSLLSEFQFVGIWGMGGIGKTCVAEFVSEQISSQFQSHCFIKSVREESERQRSQNLRAQLLSTCIAEKIDPFHIVSPAIKDRFQSTKLLVVLDDVNNFKQIDDLIEGLNFHPESKVLITTRDRQILSQLRGTEYEVKELNNEHAFELFCNHAFKRNPQTREPIEFSSSGFQQNNQIGDFVELSKSILDYVKGHPLALKVLGSSLCGKSKEDWEDALHSLKRLSRDILGILKISYNGLDPMQKNIFLDIACFFKGWKYDRVKKILNSCYESLSYDLGVLIDKSLITKTKWNAIAMHDLLQEMGWDIESTKMLKHRSRIWNHEYSIQVLKNNNDLEEIHGLFLDLSKSTDVDLSPDAFKKMSKLKFLNFYVPRFNNGVDLSNVNSFNKKLRKVKYLSNELRYLHWYGCPLKEFPSTFRLENLVELALPSSKVKKLWNEGKNSSKLISIDLHGSEHLTEIPGLSPYSSHQYLSKSSPTSRCKLTSLKELKLLGCSNLEICDDLCFISSLEVLDLSGTNIRSLPPNLKKLVRLKELSLIDCIKLQLIPDLPPNLRNLLAMNCKELRSLPRFPESQEGVNASELEIASCYNQSYDYHMINSYFIFANCWKLNENAINNFLAAAQLRFQHMATAPRRLGYHCEELRKLEIWLCLPGSEIPAWISHKSWGNSLTIDLSQYWSNNAIIGFILCGVAEETVECRRELLASFHFSHIPHVTYVRFSDYAVFCGSELLFLMYWAYAIHWIIGGKIQTLTIEFKMSGGEGKIKCCGAHPVYIDTKKAQSNISIENFAITNQDFEETLDTKISKTK